MPLLDLKYDSVLPTALFMFLQLLQLRIQVIAVLDLL